MVITGLYVMGRDMDCAKQSSSIEANIKTFPNKIVLCKWNVGQKIKETLYRWPIAIGMQIVYERKV